LIVVAAGLLSGLALLTDYHLPISTPIFLLILVYTAFTGGLSSALLSVSLTTLYHLIELVTPGGLLFYRTEDIVQVVVLILSAPLIVIMVSRLRSRAETTLAEKLEQEQAHSIELKAVLAKQTQAEEEVRLLNSHLEQRVKERTAQLQEQEQILRKQTQQIQSILDNSTTSIYLKDTEGRYLLINRQIEQRFGLDPTNAIGKTGQELFPQDETGQGFVNDRKVLESGKPLEIEEEYSLKDGLHTVLSVKFPVRDDTGKIYAVGGISTDITERKRLEREAQSSQARLSKIVTAALDAIITVDASHRIVNFNPAAENLFGYSSGEVFGQGLDRLIPALLNPGHPDFYTANFNRVADTSGPISSSDQLYALRSSGEKFPVEATVSQVETDGQQFYTIFIRDITERVQAFQLLEERVARRTAELSVLLEISQNVAANLNLPSIKGVLTGQLNKLMNFDLFSLYRRHKDGSFSLLDTSLPVAPVSLNSLVAGLNALSPWPAESAATPTPLIVDDFSDSPSAAEAFRREVSDETSFRSVMYVPLVVKEEVVGLLVLNYHEPGYYTPYHAQLAQAVGTQVATAIENARLYDQAQDIAALEERQRLARELHDSTSQVLFSIQLGSRALRNFLQEEQLSEAKETVNYLIALAKGGLDEMRALIFDLRPESIEKEGLLGALQKQIVALKDRYNLEVEVRFSQETEPELPLKYKEALYRVAREALHNVVKHASSERVELELTWDSQAIRLVVRDYGIGFEPEGDFSGHYGLHTMQERAQKLPGAKLSIESKPGEGTRVCLDVPLPRLSLSQAARD